MTSPKDLQPKLVQIQVEYDGQKLIYSKPSFENDDNAFKLKDNGCDLQIYLDRSKLKFPVTLAFFLQDDNWVISGLGFEKRKSKTDAPPVTKVTADGTKMAGGVFMLTGGVQAAEVAVVDDGTQHAFGYSFQLWIKNPNDRSAKELTFDPRVYNRVELPPLEYKSMADSSWVESESLSASSPSPQHPQSFIDRLSSWLPFLRFVGLGQKTSRRS